MGEFADRKEKEEIIMPDDYSNLFDGNANTSGDASFGDFVYQQQKSGNVTRNIRRAVITDRSSPPPFPENVSAPYEDPDLGNRKNEDPQNGTTSRNPSTLPPLQVKIDEAEAILNEIKTRNAASRSHHKDRER